MIDQLAQALDDLPDREIDLLLRSLLIALFRRGVGTLDDMRLLIEIEADLGLDHPALAA